MSRVGHTSEIIIPDGYDANRVIADNPQMSAMMAYDQNSAETVFLKLRNPEHDAHAAGRIANEANILSSLSHPQIPAFRAADPEADHPYIVTEYRDSDPTVIRRFQQFGDPTLAAELGASALNVIDYVHGEGVVHCDIKPNNLLLTWDEVALADFDISQRTGGGMDIGQHEPSKTVIGTLEYMSPEQFIADMPVDERSDVYSIGQVLLHFLSGKKPASVADRVKALKRHGQTSRDPLELWGRDVPPVLLDIAEKALQLMPDDRYQSVAEMNEDLERYLSYRSVLALAA